MKLLLKIMYDGTAYCGFQSQKNGYSVQEILTKAISALTGMDCTVTGCSRTDAGVHALGFCAAVCPAAAVSPDNPQSAENWLTIPLEKLPRAAEKFLPPDISIYAAAVMDDSFHPRYDVASKEYIYKITDTPYRNPFTAGRVWQLKRPISEEGLRQMSFAAEKIHGYRDYSSFMAAGSKIVDARRNVSRCTINREPDGIITLRISADGFLYNMVRIITGTLIDTAYGTFSPDDMDRIIEAKDRSAAGRTAPACGLYLNEVTYHQPIRWVDPK